MFGSHLSIAGSMTNALKEAEGLGLDTVQVFTKNQQQWKVPPLKDEAIAEWNAEVKRLGWHAAPPEAPTDAKGRPARLVAHASYLINLASPADELWEKSIELMRVELQRCEALGIAFLVHHPGSPTGGSAEEGLTRIGAAYKRLFKDTKGLSVVSCLENTVGAGSTIGRTLEELAALRQMIADSTGEPARVGFCFDTCHAHAGGHDMGTRASAQQVLDAFGEICGLANLKVLHLNDSKGKLGSRRDLHQHIGEGELTRSGVSDSGFAATVNHPALREVPKILETPKGTDQDGTPYDTLNLERLRKLQAPSKPINLRPRGTPASGSRPTSPSGGSRTGRRRG